VTAPSRVYLIAGLGVLLGVTGLVFKVDLGAHSPADTILVGLGAFSFIGAGVLAHARRPENATGLLMVLVGTASFAEDVQLSLTGWVHTVGMLLVGASSAFGAHLVLAFPDGRLDSRFERFLVKIAYVAVFVIIPVGALFNDTSKSRVPRPNLLLLAKDTPVHGIANRVVEVIAAAVAVCVLAVLALRWAQASTPRRWVLAPVYLAGLMGGVATLVGEVLGGGHPLRPTLLWVYWVAFCLLPLGFLVGVLRVQHGRTAVTTLLTRLEATLSGSELRLVLARALDDPGLTVAYWRPESESFVDSDGRALTVPDKGRAVRMVERDGRRVAALVHDPALRDNAPLLEAVTAAAGLALENQRLTAEVRAQLAEVRASRVRMMAASDVERRRLERDLHDGAQQRLVIAALSLRRALQQVDDTTAAEIVDLLRDCAAELQAAMDELRRLARGLHPAILTDAGLVPAVRALAERTPLEVNLTAKDVPRLPPATEAAAYFVVAEAVTNTLKHANASTLRILIDHRDGLLRIEVCDNGIGCTDSSAGSGLVGLRDRVSALDGTLTVRGFPGEGMSIVATIPVCEP
jgi:signal transduction histidine kinase